MDVKMKGDYKIHVYANSETRQALSLQGFFEKI